MLAALFDMEQCRIQPLIHAIRQSNLAAVQFSIQRHTFVQRSAIKGVRRRLLINRRRCPAPNRPIHRARRNADLDREFKAAKTGIELGLGRHLLAHRIGGKDATVECRLIITGKHGFERVAREARHKAAVVIHRVHQRTKHGLQDCRDHFRAFSTVRHQRTGQRREASRIHKQTHRRQASGAFAIGVFFADKRRHKLVHGIPRFVGNRD